jgi:hypothetical protein
MSTKRLKRPGDPVQLAKLIRDIATGQVEDSEPDNRNPHAAALGRLGGLKGGPARAKALSQAKRSEVTQQLTKSAGLG